MAMLITGALFVLLGLFSGAVLLAAPLALVPLTPEPVLWVLFPLFSILGYALFAVAARRQQVRGMSRLVAWLLLLLALLSAVALVAAAASLRPVTSTLPLWYVLCVAGLLGIVGAGANVPADTPA